jgi:Bacterial low temperature requirement A protein (LtrA)
VPTRGVIWFAGAPAPRWDDLDRDRLDSRPRAPRSPFGRWNSLFDLVFAFTITHVASILNAALTLLSVGRVAVLLVTIWWMYSGYAWLTNARP